MIMQWISLVLFMLLIGIAYQLQVIWTRKYHKIAKLQKYSQSKSQGFGIAERENNSHFSRFYILSWKKKIEGLSLF